MVANLDPFFFAVLPYVAIVIFLIVTIQRYRSHTYSYSSLSSQFLENKHHFWGMVPFHYGLITVLFGHAIGFFIPRTVLLWNGNPLRLYVLEITGFMFALLALVGLVNIIIRHAFDSKPKVVTTTLDWVVYLFLLVQILTGVGIAIFYGWGSSWFATSVSPYLWSLVTLSPNIEYVIPLPGMVKIHIITAYLIIFLFPFTRLVHILVIPNPYLWRKTQVVRWYWDRKKIRRS